MIDSYGNFIFFLGKCSMPLFNENWSLIFPSFISIIAPIVLRKGLPRIIGHEGLQSISRTIISTGTQFLFATIRTSLILPIGFLIVESARCKFREQSSKSRKSSKSHKALGIVETLAPKSHKSMKLIIFKFNLNCRFPLIMEFSRYRNF